MSWKNVTRSGPKADELKGDFQTPPIVCRYMVSLLGVSAWHVLEPTPGNGNLVKALKEDGREVTAAGNFWDLDFTCRYDAVVCNLPFSGRTFLHTPAYIASEGMEVYYKALGMVLELSPHLVALVPWFTIIDSDKRVKSLIDQGLRSVTHLPRKTFPGARITCCVIDIHKRYKGPMEFKYLTF